jgi:mRNA interferase HicA
MRKTAFPKEVVTTLLKNGFTLTRQKGSHAIYTHPSGKWTVVPMHNKELKRATFHTILKQSGLSRDDF